VRLVGTVFNRISRVQAGHNIKSVGMTHIKFSNLLPPLCQRRPRTKDTRYRIPRDCSRVYIEQTGRSVDIGLKEHRQHMQLEHPDKSAVAEHSIDQEHTFNSTMLPSSPRKPDIWTALLRRPLRLNSTREGGFCLSKSWKPLIGSLKTFGT
jgi:hypothetical protein